MASPTSFNRLLSDVRQPAQALPKSGSLLISFGTIYPSGLCLVMESFCGFSPEIPDRLVQSPSKSRDIVLYLLQTLREARSRSLNRAQGSSLLSRELTNGKICDGEE